MKLNKFFTGMCAAALALCCTAMPCAADAESDTKLDGYGRAGIVWMVMDQWDHKNSIDLEPFDEMETEVISCTHTDVNITGNGQYTVSMEGYRVPDDALDFALIGNLGVELDMDFKTYEELNVVLDEAVIDGVTYTFNEQPELEAFAEGTFRDAKVMKLKNPYGKVANTTPKMTNDPWLTTDPLTMTFTVSGLPEDKIEDNPDEETVTVFGSGSVDNDTEAPADSAAESVADTDTADSVTDEPADDVDAAAASDAENSDASSEKAEEKEDESSNWLIYVCIGCGVVVVAVVIAIIAKSKKS